MALSSYAAACDFLASAMKEDLLELLGSWADVGTSFGQEVTNVAQAFCSFEYLSQIRHRQITSTPASEEIFDFLSERTPGISPDQILDDIGVLAQESFPDIVHYSFNIVEDPELPNEERICLEIHSRGAVEAVSLQYDSFIDCLIEAFSFEVRHWFVVDINLI